MKYSIIILILLLVSCEPAIKRTPRIKEIPVRKYGGKVKRIIEYQCDQYWAKENPLKIAKNSCKIYRVSEFNSDEILIKDMYWHDLDYPNEPGFTETQRTNESGLIIERITKMTGLWANEIKTNFSYNQAGFETEKVVYRKGIFSSREETIYDEYNCPIKEISYDENNEVEDYKENKYDNRNRIVLSLQYKKDNTLEEKCSYEYDGDDEDWIVKKTYDAIGRLIDEEDERDSYKTNKVDYLYTSRLPDEGFTDVEYYSNGKVKEWHFINEEDYDIYQTYDENGRIIERKIYSNGEWQDTNTWKYREDNALIEESESTSRVVGKSYYKTTTYYSVDFNGNWIEKITTDSEGNVLELRVREIEYY